MMLSLFLAFTIGVPLHRHYCGTELFSSGIVPKDCCCENTVANPDDCCTSEADYFNLDQEYDLHAPLKLKLDLPALAMIRVLYLPQVFPVSVEEAVKPAVSDQRKQKVPIYKLLNEYTLYG
ncbi:MAG: hypothetical protein V4616_00090 [Bacteroidota bacterium]